MAHKNVSVKLALRFVQDAFKRRDYARALFWNDVARETIEKHASGLLPRRTRSRREARHRHARGKSATSNAAKTLFAATQSWLALVFKRWTHHHTHQIEFQPPRAIN